MFWNSGRQDSQKRFKRKYLISVSIIFIFFLLFFITHTERYKVKHAVLKLTSEAGINEQDVGFELYNVTKGEKLWSINENKKFSLASLNKIFTASAILHYMNPDLVFSTTVAGTKSGSLYIVGSGDPLFSYQNMEDLVNKLALIGIKQIKGDIILDNTLFKPKSMYTGTFSTVATSPLLANLNLAQLKEGNLKGKPIYSDIYGCIKTSANELQQTNDPAYSENISIHIEDPSAITCVF